MARRFHPRSFGTGSKKKKLQKRSYTTGDSDLTGADLYRINAQHADFSGAQLCEVNLDGSAMGNAVLKGVDFSDACLFGVNFMKSDLRGANFDRADLRDAVFHSVHLNGANFDSAALQSTAFLFSDLGNISGLDNCQHIGPSTIDFFSLRISGDLSHKFLRGCGYSDQLINYLPSFQEEAIQYYTCFISYSTKDQEFADRVHADLQAEGVRCWFAPHDLPIGAKTWDAIDEAIKLRDKLLLVLSRDAISSDWVEDEVNKAFAEERRRKKTVLFPIRIDDFVMSTDKPWAVKLRDQRNIGDFQEWKNHDSYLKNLSRIVRDLKV